MTVMTAKPNESAKKAAKQIEIDVTPEEHLQVVASFTVDCLEVEFQKSAGLPTAKQASRDSVLRVAHEAEGDDDAFGVTKKLLRAKTPIIDKISEWKRTIDEVRNAFTFSVASSQKATSRDVKKARGKRLIRKDDVEAFEQAMVDLEVKGTLISKELYEQYDTVLALEKKRLGKEFRQDDYPVKETLYREIEESVENMEGVVQGVLKKYGALSIGGRTYTEVTAPVSLPEEVQKRMMAQTYEKLNDSVEVIIADIAATVGDTFATLADELTETLVVRPRYDSPAYKKMGSEGEVVSQRTREDDVNVPDGQVLYTIRWKAGKGREMRQADFGPMSEEEFETTFRPEEKAVGTGIHKSVVVRFENYLTQFSNLKEKLGVYGERMDEALEVLRDLHHTAVSGKHKKGTDTVIDTLKHSTGFRKKMRTALLDVKETIEHVAAKAGEVRRKVSGSIAAKLAKMQ